MPTPPQTDRPDDERVPVFRTWPRIYAAVVLCTVIVTALLALFSRWPY